jgi:uncharacterized protein (TIGR03067 family)
MMKSLLFISIFNILLGMFAFAVQGGPAQGSDEEIVRGVWVVIHSEDSGKEVSPAKDLALVLDKNKVIARLRGEIIAEGIYSLDSSKTPKWIDITIQDRNYLGIYQLEGDILRICHGDPDQPIRSTRFVSEPGTENRVVVLLRRAGG